MSRAFVKEPDNIALEAPPELLPTEGPNPVTQAGFDRMQAWIADLQAQITAETDEATRNRLARDLRYWEAESASATIMPRVEGNEIGFGSLVTLTRNQHMQTIELVGESEADPGKGRINWQAPLAGALMGRRAGERFTLGEREPIQTIEIVAVDNS